MGIWRSDVADQFFPHVVPQASGNHTGVRWASLTSKRGGGLLVTALGDPLEVAALHQTEAAIEAAAHPHEVVADDVVHLTIDGAQQGLGNSWAETALPAYTLLSSEARSVQYVLSPLRRSKDAPSLARRTLDLDLLEEVQVDGEALPRFHTDVTSYTVTYSSAVERDVPVVSVIPTTSGVEFEVTQAAGLPGDATITAHSADGLVSTTYTIHFELIDEVKLSEIDWASASVGWGTPGRNVTVTGDPLQLLTAEGVTTFASGLGVHAEAEIVYDLAPWEFSMFRALVGVEQHAARDGRRFVFQVVLDDVVVWDSGVMTKSTQALPVEVDVSGASTLRLLMNVAGDGNGHGHGAWADARLED